MGRLDVGRTGHPLLPKDKSSERLGPSQIRPPIMNRASFMRLTAIAAAQSMGSVLLSGNENAEEKDATWGFPQDSTWYRPSDNAPAVFSLYFQPSARPIPNHGRGPLLMLGLWADGHIMTLDARKEGKDDAVVERYLQFKVDSATIEKFWTELAKLGLSSGGENLDYRSFGLGKSYMQMSVIENEKMTFWTGSWRADYWLVRSFSPPEFETTGSERLDQVRDSWYAARILASTLLAGEGKEIPATFAKCHRPNRFYDI